MIILLRIRSDLAAGVMLTRRSSYEILIVSRRSSGVEQLIRNQQVAGSNPIAGSI